MPHNSGQSLKYCKPIFVILSQRQKLIKFSPTSSEFFLLILSRFISFDKILDLESDLPCRRIQYTFPELCTSMVELSIFPVFLMHPINLCVYHATSHMTSFLR